MDNMLNMLIDGCTWGEIKEMFKNDAYDNSKRVLYEGKTYQCHFVGFRCCGTSLVNE